MVIGKDPAPCHFESGQIATVDNQTSVDLFVGRYLRINVDVGETNCLRDEGYVTTIG
jgi:hypothetical protein